MKAWLAAHAYSLRSALARFGSRPIASSLEAIVLAVALALPLAFMLLVENVRALAAGHPATPEISLYLALDAGPADIDRIGRQLSGIEGAENIRYVPKAQAYERLRQSTALADILEALPANPLPDAFTIRVRDADANRLRQLEHEIAAWPRVARVQLDSEWAHRLDSLIRIGWAAAAVLGVILALAMVAIVFNTVRLQLLQQREEIVLSRLIGATDAFVRRPFLYFGVLEGLVGAALALALVAAAHALAATELSEISVTYGAMLELQPLPWTVAAAVLGTGAMLGYAAAGLAATRMLRAR
jgi:cell division transport system permease protein